MRKTAFRLIIVLVLLLPCRQNCFGQALPDSRVTVTDKLGSQYINSISEKSAAITEKIDKQTERYLSKLEKQEVKLKRKLSKIDSLAANKIFDGAQQQYRQLQDKARNKSQQLQNTKAKYLPWLDSASTSLQFLEKNPLINGLKGDAAKLNGAISKLKELKNQLQQAASVKDFIKQRKEYLQQQLQQYNLGSELKKYNQTAYYYSQQINEYQQALNEPEKAERKVLALLNTVPAFRDFMQKNSMLAAMFATPGAGVGPGAVVQNLQGLQTTASVQALVQNQLAAGGPNAQAMFQQNMQEAQGMLNSLKAKLDQQLNQLRSNGGDDLESPDFKPNTQKTKTFLQRLEYGANIQSVKSNYNFPTTTDIALSVGYRLNEKSIIGIGASYKMGWGKDIKHISISAEGMGLRSFADMKLKGSFFASGGFEYNYQPLSATISSAAGVGRGEAAWQQSGLLGITKVISLKTKYFKKTKLQLLWDFLSYQQRSVTEPLKFRVGYSL